VKLGVLVTSLLLILGCYHPQPTIAEQNLVPRHSIVVSGTLRNVHEDWTFEHPCGIIAAVMRQCDDVQAFVGEIVKPDSHTVQVMFFRHSDGGPHPANGDLGNWTLHWDAVYRYLTCAQRSGMTSACLAEFSWVIESDSDWEVLN
jgi:hypothetical protein